MSDYTRPTRPQRRDSGETQPIEVRGQAIDVNGYDADPAYGYYDQELPTVPAPPVKRVRKRRRGDTRRGDARRKGGAGTIFGYTPRAIAIGTAAGLAVIGLLSVLTVVGAYFYFQLLELILPGVSVAGVDVGALSRQAATAKLEAEWSDGESIILSDGVQNWVAPPADFGIALDAAASAQRAYDVGHGGPILEEIYTLLDSTLVGTPVEPVVGFDPVQAQLGIETWASVLHKEPQDASLVIDGGLLTPVAGVPGYYLDVGATLNVLAADPGAALADSYLPLVLVPVAPRIPDASAAIAEAQTLLSAPLTMTAYDPISDENFAWTADPATIAGWLGVESTDAGPHVIVQADRLSGWLSDIESGLGQGRTVNAEESAPQIEAALRSHTPVTLTIRHAPTTYTVQPGETLTQVSWNVGIPYWRILEANPGMDADTISVGQTLNIPSKDDLLPLPVIANKRIRVSISQQRLWTYENGQLAHEYVISTGIDRSPTQPGIFQVQDHTPSVYASLWDLTMPNFLSIYESWPGFFNGFHGLPTLSNGQLLWREILGKPASYGCIILDLPDGQALYDWADNGVVVEIDE